MVKKILAEIIMRLAIIAMIVIVTIIIIVILATRLTKTIIAMIQN